MYKIVIILEISTYYLKYVSVFEYTAYKIITIILAYLQFIMNLPSRSSCKIISKNDQNIRDFLQRLLHKVSRE